MDISYEGQVAVITGGGGGIGRLLSLELARRGASVVVNDVGGVGHPNGPSADDVVEEVEAQGGKAIASYDTVGTPEGGKAILDLAIDTYGTIDAIFHLAGTWRHFLYEEMTPERVDDVVDVHLLGGFYVTQPAWSLFKEKGYGRIVLCGSSSGIFGRRFGSNYAGGKAGLWGLCRALALEGAEHGIKTNLLMPIASSKKKYVEMPPQIMLDDFKQSGFQGGTPLPPGAIAERLVPLPTYLGSRDCAVNGEAFSGGAGRYSRVFAGVTDGWLSPANTIPTAEDIAEHLDEIEDRTNYIVPANIYDELIKIGEDIAKRDGTPFGTLVD